MSDDKHNYKVDPPPYEFDEVSLLMGRLQGIGIALTVLEETAQEYDRMLEEALKKEKSSGGD